MRRGQRRGAGASWNFGNCAICLSMLSAGPAARRGRQLERLARRVYEQEVGIQMEPLCLVHDQLEWMRASLDGLSFDGLTVLEIKCPMNVRDQSTAQQGSVPPHYYAQLQHELEVSRAAEAHYWSFDGRAGSLVRGSLD